MKIRQLVINLMTNVQVLGSVGAKRMILSPNIRKRTEPRQNGDIQDPIMRGIKNLVSQNNFALVRNTSFAQTFPSYKRNTKEAN